MLWADWLLESASVCAEGSERYGNQTNNSDEWNPARARRRTVRTDTILWLTHGSLSGEWLAYSVESGGGTATLTVRLASAYDAKSFHLELDGANVTGTLTIPNTGGGQNWTDVTTEPITVGAGLHTLRFVADSGNFNLNYLEVVP